MSATTALAGMLEVVIAGVSTPAASASVMIRFIAPEATVAVTLEDAEFVICKACELPLQILAEAGLTVAVNGLTVKVAIPEKSTAVQDPVNIERY
jgi:hypothetical protein